MAAHPMSCNIELPPIRCKASGLVLQEESVSISTYHNTLDPTNTHINASAAIQAAKIRVVTTHHTTLQTKKQLLQMYKFLPQDEVISADFLGPDEGL